MGARERLAVGVAPFFIRVALGLTFLWAGAVKLFSDTEYKGEQAAALANMGVAIMPSRTATPPTPQPPVSPTTTPSGAAPAQPGNPANPPVMQPPAQPIPMGEPESPRKAPKGEADPLAATMFVQPAGGSQPAPAPAPPPKFTASDFPTPVSLRRVFQLALGIEAAAKIPAEAKNRFELWPRMFAQGERPVYFAFAAAITELVGGAMVLLGVFGRLGALSLAWIMLVAMWLTQIGPAVQMDRTVLLILPNWPWYDLESWQHLLYQFMLFMAAIALFFSGSGGASIDSMLASGSAPRAKATKPPQDD